MAQIKLSDLTVIPGVGKSLAQDLQDLGIKTVKELQRCDPQKLYDNLISLRGQHQDRCVLYVFRCAIYFANTPHPEPELLKWWNWKDKQSTA